MTIEKLQKASDLHCKINDVENALKNCESRLFIDNRECYGPSDSKSMLNSINADVKKFAINLLENKLKALKKEFAAF